MNHRPIYLLLLGTLTLLVMPGPAHGEGGRTSWGCRDLGALPRSQPAPGSLRHYAPSRQIDILHLALEVTPDFEARTVQGQATLQFVPIAQPLAELALDGLNLRVSSVTASHPIQAWQATRDQIIVTFQSPVPAGTQAEVSVSYQASPKRGLYFRTPAMGYPADATHLWTQGEAIEARHWFPSYDFPNEKFTSEVTCRVPPDMVVLSNGRQVSASLDADSGLKAVRWLQDKPHVNYLISLVAGHFNSVRDQYRDIPLAFHTPPSEIQWAPRSFDGTKEMLAFFEQEIGVPYPWDKYDQVCVLDFHWGGMENTSLTTLNVSTLHTAESESLQSSQGLVAHELAHQWFGDLVTCKDWSHLWLNEGFATYYEALYDGHVHGPDMLRYRLYESAHGIASQNDDTRAMVRRDFHQPDELFNYLAYPKGSWILHMLRCQLGPDLYRRCIRTYLERHRFGLAETEDLVAVLEELTGRSFDQFFDQYVYHAHHPELAVQYHWDASTRLAKISVRQKQPLSDKILLFHVDLPIRFHTPNGIVDRKITVAEASGDFYFPLEDAPRIVRIDPELTLLAEIEFAPPHAMLYAQLENPEDMLGRLIAARQLGQNKDRDAISQLKQRLQEDPFFGVRLQASQALRDIGTDEAFQALHDCLDQQDARVRQQVVRDVTSRYRETACETALNILRSETNPDIRAVALEALGTFAKPEVRETLLKALTTESFRNRLANAAIQALRTQQDSSCVQPLLHHLQNHEADFFYAHDFGQALDTLAFLARNLETPAQQPVLQLLLDHLQNPKEGVRQAALQALGTLGNPQATAPLQTFTHAPHGDPDRAAAERALAQLQQSPRHTPDLGSLRNEVLELQNQNRQLRQEFDDLKKKLDALIPHNAQGRESSPKTDPE